MLIDGTASSNGVAAQTTKSNLKPVACAQAEIQYLQQHKLEANGGDIALLTYQSNYKRPIIPPEIRSRYLSCRQA